MTIPKEEVCSRCKRRVEDCICCPQCGRVCVVSEDKLFCEHCGYVRSKAGLEGE